MKPFNDYDLGSIIKNQQETAHNKIESLSNEEIMANDLEVLAENIYQEFFIEPVTIYEEDFSKRKIEQGKISEYVDPFFRDYDDQKYIEVDGVIATFYYPYTGDADLFKCRASTFSLSGYPEISVDNEMVSFRIEQSLSKMKGENAEKVILGSLEYNLEKVKTGVSYANKDVEVFNASLRDQALEWLEKKRKNVEQFFDIATMLEVPIEKTEYAETHIPLKRKINPVNKHYQASDYYDISENDYNDILQTIKHTGSTYERTPGSYKTLQEEDLRNTLLAALNATYKGDAMGEAFRNTGKTDICIERENRAAFVAECKMWKGQKEISKAIEQLNGYLTWRDCKTALIYFVRRKDFMKTLEVANAALHDVEGMRNVKPIDKNEYDCLFLSKTNPGQQIRMRVMLFNLYCET